MYIYLTKQNMVFSRLTLYFHNSRYILVAQFVEAHDSRCISLNVLNL